MNAKEHLKGKTETDSINATIASLSAVIFPAHPFFPAPPTPGADASFHEKACLIERLKNAISHEWLSSLHRIYTYPEEINLRAGMLAEAYLGARTELLASGWKSGAAEDYVIALDGLQNQCCRDAGVKVKGCSIPLWYCGRMMFAGGRWMPSADGPVTELDGIPRRAHPLKDVRPPHLIEPVFRPVDAEEAGLRRDVVWAAFDAAMDFMRARKDAKGVWFHLWVRGTAPYGVARALGLLAVAAQDACNDGLRGLEPDAAELIYS